MSYAFTGNKYSSFIFVKYFDFTDSGHWRSLIMKKNLKSEKGISPILAALLLILIGMAAVIVTYAWVMTFTGSPTSQARADLNVDKVRFYTQGTNDKIEVVIINSGTSASKAVEVYQGTSSSDLQQVSSVTYDPPSQIISEGSSLKIILNIDWESGIKYYFKVVTEDGINLLFSEEAA